MNSFTTAYRQRTMKEWTYFYLAVANASAALTGLIVVGVSMSLSKILSIRMLPGRALLSLLLLALVVSILFLVLELTAKTPGILMLVIGTINWLVVTRLDFTTSQNQHKPLKQQHRFIRLIDQFATLCFSVTGNAITASWPMRAYRIESALVFFLGKAGLAGWARLAGINR